MNNTDNNNTGNKVGSSEAAYTMPNNNTTSDIYERFLNRVQNIDNEDNLDASSLESLESVKKPSMYEPLSEEELRLFTDHEQGVDPQESDIISVEMNFDDSEAVIPELNDILNSKNEVVVVLADDKPEHTDTEKTEVAQDKPASSKKSLIIGLICGLLLSAIVIVLLNTMGVLSTSKDRLVSDADKIIASSAPAVNAEQQVSINTDKTPTVEPEVKTQKAAPQADQNNTLIADNALNNNKDEPVANQKEVPVVTKKSEEPSNSNLDADAAITYEDFREEAQSTLYRETKD